jgi:hypothetical protein
MKLLIPKDEAIAILRKRLQELSAYNFNQKVWKDRTILDLKQIFGSFSEQWLQISAIYFDTAVTSQKAQKLEEGKQSAVGLLNSYIDFIEQYTKIAQQGAQIKEKGFEDKYYNLLGQYNVQAKECITLMDEHSALLDENLKLLKQVDDTISENNRLIDNTLQLDNVSFKRLWQAVQNLPTFQVVTLISLLVGLMIAAFSLGQVVESAGSNNESFELKTENRELKNKTNNLQDIINQRNVIIGNLNDSFLRYNSMTPKRNLNY